MPLSTIDTASISGLGYGFKNRIINGAMVIDQRNAGASGTASAYTVDRWGYNATQASKITWQQNAGSVTPPAGFINYLGFTSSSAYSVLTGDTFYASQSVEGFNVADLGWGAAGAATVTLSFWVRSSLTGNFGGALVNSAGNRSYPFTFTINAANTWELETITIAGDTSGTWLTTNGIGITLRVGLGSGATYSGTSGAWAAGNLVQPTSTVSVVGTSGATFYITGVQLEKGSTATSFDYRPYGTELALCQRYYYKMVSPSASEQYFASGSYYAASLFAFTYSFPVTMRTVPTLDYVTGASYYKIYTNNTSDTVDAFSAARMHTNGGGADTGAGTSGTVGQGGSISTNNASASVAFSAEL